MPPVPPRFAVIGKPIAHSLSPALFRWLFARLGIDATYDAREVSPEVLPAFVAELRQGDWQGASVTLPHKETVLKHLQGTEPLAARIGAVNTLVSVAAKTVKGHNTDAVGFVRALERHGTPLKGASVLVLGAGGAARAAVFTALDQGAAEIHVANRTLERATALAQDASGGRVRSLPLTQEALAQTWGGVGVLVNSTRVGMGAPNESPLPKGLALRPGLTVLDMVYRPLETALLRRARAEGARPVDGLWMLVYQALEQLRLWTGRSVTEEMAEELHAHLCKEAT
jgi:shikimate dehydrogenase